MSRWIALAGILILGVAAIFWSERQKVDVEANPAPVLYLVADTEQELTRLPVSFTRMSDADEIRIGIALARSYESGQNENNRAEILAVEAYLNQVGEKLATHAHRKLPYKFHYIPNRYFINAFALPGGHVFVGSGLLALMDSEDELASVLGHEIEHIDHYHCAERAQQEEALRRIPLGELVALPIEIFEAGYSKDQELEADREGTRLAVRDGYSANGAIRMFEAFQRLYLEYKAKARSPQEELSQVAQQTLEGYFRSHPLPSERIAQIQKLIASEGWPARPERDLAVAYIFLADKAEEAMARKQYGQAEQIAAQSIKVHPEQPAAYEILARAQFAQGKFSDAANSYHALLRLEWARPELLESFALALAGSNRKNAAGEFRNWKDLQTYKSQELEVIQAGLDLLAGDSAPAHKLHSDLNASSESRAPLWEGELGWWFYLAGDYPEALDLLNAAAQQRPGETELWVRLGWVQIELHHISDAMQYNSVYTTKQLSEKTMMQAVGFWQATERDQALTDFASAAVSQPEWENPDWVKAMYSPLAVKSIQEMQNEREARQKARTAHVGSN